MRRLIVASALALLLPVAACGDKDDTADGADTTSSSTADAAKAPEQPCDVTSADAVADVFGGTVTSTTPGTTRNCSYAIDGGAADDVEVFYFGSADDYKVIKANYEVNRGPLTDVPGVGDDAFNPGDFKQNEIVVLQGDTIFAVGLGGTPTTTPIPQVEQLAQRIADDLG